MSTLDKVIKKSFERSFWSHKNIQKEKPDLDNHFKNQIEFRENILESSRGRIKYITSVNPTSNLNLPIDDKSNLTYDALKKLKNVKEEKIAILIKHIDTGAYFVRLVDKPNKGEWNNSEIKEILYSEGITVNSIEDIIDTEIDLDIKDKNTLKNNITVKTILQFIISKPRNLIHVAIVLSLIPSIFYYMNIFISIFTVSILIGYLLLYYKSLYYNMERDKYE